MPFRTRLLPILRPCMTDLLAGVGTSRLCLGRRTYTRQWRRTRCSQAAWCYASASRIYLAPRRRFSAEPRPGSIPGPSLSRLDSPCRLDRHLTDTLRGYWHRPRFTPAHVLPGRHSLNGSDYTSFEVRRWGKPGGNGQALFARDAQIIFQTTTLTQSGGLCEGADAERCDLLASVTCKGADCHNLAVTLSGSFEWGRVGHVALANTADVMLTAPGFPDVTAFSASCSTAIAEGETGDTTLDSDGKPKKPTAPMQFLRFHDAHTVGVSTGQRRDVGSISTAIVAAAARADVLPPRLQAVAALALPTLDVLAWNTLFTTSLHVCILQAVKVVFHSLPECFSLSVGPLWPHVLCGAGTRP
jgi:hypothetical protein